MDIPGFRLHALVGTIGPMHNPPHPGEFIRDVDLSELQMSVRELATRLKVAPSTLNRILQERSRVTPEMALRLSRCLGRSAESWLAMQDAYDLWHARQQLDLSGITSVVAAGR
jgi:addiction module HigA family antidote